MKWVKLACIKSYLSSELYRIFDLQIQDERAAISQKRKPYALDITQNQTQASRTLPNSYEVCLRL